MYSPSQQPDCPWPTWPTPSATLRAVVRRSLGSAVMEMGARSKLEAIVIALRHGAIELPDA